MCLNGKEINFPNPQNKSILTTQQSAHLCKALVKKRLKKKKRVLTNKRIKENTQLPGDPDGLADLSSPFMENISDTPKSTIFTVPSAVMRRLSGLISSNNLS
jgi:hypothetical protein